MASAAEIIQKFMGDSEKEVEAVFARATSVQPVILFFDEIDALMTQRMENEHSSERRVKTTFLKCMETTPANVFVFAATNCAYQIDIAFKRRFNYCAAVGMPELAARTEIIRTRMPTPHRLTDADIRDLAQKSSGRSGSEIINALRLSRCGPYEELHRTTHFKMVDGEWEPCNAGDAGARAYQWMTVPAPVRVRPVECADIVFVPPLYSIEQIEKCMQF